MLQVLFAFRGSVLISSDRNHLQEFSRKTAGNSNLPKSGGKKKALKFVLDT